ncbi:hypothetical protein ACWA5Z_04780 [Testudinibacter sp. P80/BLE/0925]|uniref:hypothetical protein n=1 Tax=Testudinibacter sp. TW-1 TaxID=3417757 RepID=UPI003D368F8D
MRGALVLTALLSLWLNVVAAYFLAVAFIFALFRLCQVEFRHDVAERLRKFGRCLSFAADACSATTLLITIMNVFR